MNEFIADDVWQRRMRDEILVPGFYQRVFHGKFHLFDRMMDAQHQGIDTVVERGDELIYIEEKIVRYKGRRYEAFALETKSCTVKGREKDGWMVTGKADILLYCFETFESRLDCWWLDFPALKAWFLPIADRFAFSRTEQINRSEVRVVPIMDVRKAVPWKNFQLCRLP